MLASSNVKICKNITFCKLMSIYLKYQTTWFCLIFSTRNRFSSFAEMKFPQFQKWKLESCQSLYTKNLIDEELLENQKLASITVYKLSTALIQVLLWVFFSSWEAYFFKSTTSYHSPIWITEIYSINCPLKKHCLCAILQQGQEKH